MAMAMVKQQQALTEAKRVVDLLTKARALLIKGWCKNSDALNKNGDEVDFMSRAAVEFCSSGAINRVTYSLGTSKAAGDIRKRIFNFVLAAVKSPNITAWNDASDRRKPQIIKGFTGGINLATEALKGLQQPTKKVVATRSK